MDREERRRILQEIAGKHFSRADERIDGRAWEPYMKKQIIDRLYDVWSMNPDMRFGQLLMVACKGIDLFYVEDFGLAETVEEYYEHRKTL